MQKNDLIFLLCICCNDYGYCCMTEIKIPVPVCVYLIPMYMLCSLDNKQKKPHFHLLVKLACHIQFFFATHFVCRFAHRYRIIWVFIQRPYKAVVDPALPPPKPTSIQAKKTKTKTCDSLAIVFSCFLLLSVFACYFHSSCCSYRSTPLDIASMLRRKWLFRWIFIQRKYQS